MKKKKKKLPVLKISIAIVVVVFLLAFVLTICNQKISNNPVSNEEFKEDLIKYQSELSLYIQNKLVEKHIYDPSNDTDLKNVEKDKLLSILPSYNTKYNDTIKILNGVLVCISKDERQVSIANELNIGTDEFKFSAVPLFSYAKENSTINGMNPSYYNPIIPKGFRAVNQKHSIWPREFEKGLVITGKENNEFVWIPVKDINEFKRQDFENTPEKFLEYKETEDTKEYLAMKDSVLKYGGFYISAVSAKKSLTGARVSVDRQSKTLNDVVWGGKSTEKASDGFTGNDFKDGAVNLARSLYPNDNTNKTGVISTLPYGVQWDCTMKFLQNIQLQDTYGFTLILNEKINGKYLEEWTMETTEKGRVKRTMNTDTGIPTIRIVADTNSANDNTGFRCVLYVK